MWTVCPVCYTPAKLMSGVLLPVKQLLTMDCFGSGREALGILYSTLEFVAYIEVLYCALVTL